jgi:acetyl-CoA synthetase
VISSVDNAETNDGLVGSNASRMLSYDQARADYRAQIPANFKATDIIDVWAVEAPDDLALLTLDADGEIVDTKTVAELVTESCAFARGLRALGINKGDHIFIMLPRVSAWYAAMLGAMRIGAVPMPGPNMLTAKDIGYRVSRGRAVAAITDSSGAAKVDAGCPSEDPLQHRIVWRDDDRALPDGWIDFASLAAAPDVGATFPPIIATDPLLIYFTSGTVSDPKMVEHVQSYALGHVATARFWHDLHPGDLHWTVSDTGWAKAAWGGLFGQWHERATVVQVALARPDPTLILGILARNRITSFCAPPTLYRQLILADFAPHDLSALRHCTSAGEPLNPEVIRVWEERTGLRIYDGYGQTESTVLVANFPALPIRPGSMGKPVPGYDVDIRDEDGNAVADGVAGAIAARTDPHPIGLFTGYYEDPEATAERFRHGWYYTGDRGVRDPDGYIWFESRDDDVITSSAYRIGPFEVESALLEHPAVAEAGVVGRPDPARTEIVCAFVILAPGHSGCDALTIELQNHVKATTAPYKYPREIRYVETLPKTISGKIRRTELRAQLVAENALSRNSGDSS